MKILFVFETKAQKKVRENYRLSVRQRTCVLFKKKKHAKLTQNKSTKKVRENYRLSVRQTILCFLFVKKHANNVFVKNSKHKVRENYRLSVRQASMYVLCFILKKKCKTMCL